MNVLPTAGGSETVVVVLDDSYSMGQKVGSGATFSAATTDLANQVKGLHKSTNVCILLASKPKDCQAFLGLGEIPDPDGLAGRIKTLQLSDMRAQLPERSARPRTSSGGLPAQSGSTSTATSARWT